MDIRMGKPAWLIAMRRILNKCKLTKSPDQYTVGSILRLTEGSLAPVSCLESPDALSCERMDCCRTLPMWRGLDHLINNYLDNITLADLIQPEEPWSNYVI